MEEAYLKASADDTLPANARQIMYAARGHIQERTGKQLKDTYFTQTLLPDYIREHSPAWSDKVHYDNRGHFREPHTGHKIGLGTAAVRSYLGRTADAKIETAFETSVQTSGPASRFGGVLFVEKEGFDALFDAVQMAERYDLAFMSTKGISVTAARELAERLCSTHQHPALRPARLRQGRVYRSRHVPAQQPALHLQAAVRGGRSRPAARRRAGASASKTWPRMSSTRAARMPAPRTSR